MTTNFDNLVGKKSPDSSLIESDFFGVKGMEFYKQLESKIPDADFARPYRE
jgi:hypothetical protein